MNAEKPIEKNETLTRDQTDAQAGEISPARRPFVEPQLMHRGDLSEVTAGAFGVFSV